MSYGVLCRRTAMSNRKEHIAIDNKYRTIGQECFKNSIRIRTVVMPETEMIEQQAFYSCTALQSAVFPKMKKIMKEAFAGCSNLTGVSFPSQLIFLGQSAFDRCKRLESISFDGKSELKTIETGAFAECRYLHELALPEQLEYIEKEAFYKCDQLKQILLPDTIKSIGDQAFYQCGLEELHLPQHVACIGDGAFLKCKNLEYVKIPDSVQYLGKWAFHGCNRLQMLEIAHDPEFIGEWITNKNCTIRCKQGSRMESYALKNELHLEYI